MYRTKLEYFRKLFKEKNCFSAIATTQINDVLIGTPMVVSSAQLPRSKSQKNPLARKPTSHGGVRLGGMRSGGAGGIVVTRSTPDEIVEAREDEESPVLANDPNAEVAMDSPQIRNTVVQEGGRIRGYDQNTYGITSDVETLGAAIFSGQEAESKLYDRALKTRKAPTESIDPIQLYDMEVRVANLLLQTSFQRGTALVLFKAANNDVDFNKMKISNDQMYFDGKRPLIFDAGHSFELERLSDIYKIKELKDFSNIISSSLKDNRYVNYTFTGVTMSNKKYMLEDVYSIFNSLRKVYPAHVSFFRTANIEGLRRLIDTVSISFYKLEDVIPIFDFKHTIGVAVEVFLTSSTNTPDDTNVSGVSATYRFLFSKHRENIFSIDGEPLKRSFDSPVDRAIQEVCWVIDKHSPNDTKIKKRKK